jgi:hypothetical protein
MTGDLLKVDDWFKEFDNLFEQLVEVRAMVKSCSHMVNEKVIVKDIYSKEMHIDLKNTINKINKELNSIDDTQNKIRWCFLSNPLDKWSSGQRLTKEEFYLLAAQGCITVSSTSDKEEAYEEYFHYLYEDNKCKGYINSNEYIDPLSTYDNSISGDRSHENGHFRIGIAPENVSTNFLRDDQLEYFKNYKPELFSRFNKKY